jgi:hypothetical protein
MFEKPHKTGEKGTFKDEHKHKLDKSSVIRQSFLNFVPRQVSEKLIIAGVIEIF